MDLLGAESSHRSLIMASVVRQVSSDDRDSRHSPQEPMEPVITSFGQEFRLMCPICLQDLKQPRQLSPCYHIFCSACLEGFLGNDELVSIRCPVATCGTDCRKEDVTIAVSNDIYLRALPGRVSMYVESGSVTCSDPSHEDHEESADYFCFECKNNFCKSCQVNHCDNEALKGHHSLRLFKTPATTTIGLNTREEDVTYGPPEGGASGGQDRYQCPACRNTDICDHEYWLKNLLDEKARKQQKCPIPKHASDLIAFCNDCEEPVCPNCSKIVHKDCPNVVDINDGFIAEKKLEISSFVKNLEFLNEIFSDASKQVDDAKTEFLKHVQQMEEEMVNRKVAVHTRVEEAFAMAFALVGETGEKQAELMEQSKQMHREEQFLTASINLGKQILEGGKSVSDIEFVRVWQGLKAIKNGMAGEGKKGVAAGEGQTVIPQKVVETRLVLPTAACMTPDLRILKKVGVENTILRKSFVLKAEQQLLLFYSILPLTDTVALVSCKTEALASSVVQYSNFSSEHHSVRLKETGQYSIIAVPGNGIVATLYQAGKSGRGSSEEKKQILFWDQALDTSMTELEAQGAGDKLKLLAETELPPRGIAVTRDNHLVVCMAEDPPKAGDGPGRSSIVVMTMRGQILHKKCLGACGLGPGSEPYFPKYVTVNINGDICVTDYKDQSVSIYSDTLEFWKLRMISPYKDRDERLNDTFYPMGICHDSFGRLIVADSNNHCVLRFEYETMAQNPEIIVRDGQNDVSDLSYPTLVALGPGPKLWVVCRSNIQVFDYADKE